MSIASALDKMQQTLVFNLIADMYLLCLVMLSQLSIVKIVVNTIQNHVEHEYLVNMSDLNKSNQAGKQVPAVMNDFRKN